MATETRSNGTPPMPTPRFVGAEHWAGAEGHFYERTGGARACAITGEPVPAGPAWMLRITAPDGEDVFALAGPKAWPLKPQEPQSEPETAKGKADK